MEAGQQCLNLEVVAVHDLGSQDRTTQRGAKDRSDTGADPAANSDTSIRRAEVEEPSKQRTKACTDLTCGSFSSSRAAGADGER